MQENWTGFVLNHLWQSSVCVCLAWSLTRLLYKQQAKIRYAIWFAASIKFLVPLSLFVGLGSSMHTASRAVPSAPVVDATITKISQPFEGGTIAIDSDVNAVHSLTDLPPNLLPICAGAIWAVGIVVLATLWTREWFRLRKLSREASLLVVHAGVPIRITKTMNEPGAFGVFRPVIVIPESIVVRLTPSQFEAVLEHELQHISRRDNLTAMVHLVVQGLFWFHPLVWWLRGKLTEERELACDEAVMLSNPDAFSYVEGILEVCKIYTEQPLMCVSGITGADLKKRVAYILNGPVAEKFTRSKQLLLLGALIVVLGTPLVTGLLRVHAATTLAYTEEERASVLVAMPSMKFANASVRSNTAGTPPYGPSPDSNIDLDPGEIYSPTGGVFSVRNKSLRTLMAFAYKMSGNQQNYLKHHVPDFVLNERFDIDARAALRNPTKDQMRAMVRSLLEERFDLRMHNETVQADLFHMSLARSGRLGSSIRIHSAQDKICNSGPSKAQSSDPLKDGFPAVCGAIVRMPTTGIGTNSKFVMKIGGRNVPLSLVASAMGSPYTGDTGLDRSVVENTGMRDNVDFTLSLGFNDLEDTFTPMTQAMFPTELRQQLGMVMAPGRGPINVYVVDHVEHLRND